MLMLLLKLPLVLALLNYKPVRILGNTNVAGSEKVQAS